MNFVLKIIPLFTQQTVVGMFRFLQALAHGAVDRQPPQLLEYAEKRRDKVVGSRTKGIFQRSPLA